MRYLEIDTGEPIGDTEPVWWEKILEWVVPAGNPDLEPYIRRTQSWWLEIDDDGLPQREIGFDGNRVAIVLSPVEGNVGFLMDASDDWSDSDKDSAEAAENFDRVWESLWPRFKDIDERNSPKSASRTNRV